MPSIWSPLSRLVPEIMVSSDDDLLVLHPWRGVRILRSADYLGIA